MLGPHPPPSRRTRLFVSCLAAILVSCGDDQPSGPSQQRGPDGRTTKRLPKNWVAHPGADQIVPRENDGTSKGLRGAGFLWEPNLGTGLGLADDDCDLLSLGFTFTFFGQTYESVWVNSNGNLTFNGCETEWWHPDIPDGTNIIIAPLYGDFDPEVNGDVLFNTLGTAPNRRFVVTWSGVPEYSEERDPTLPPSTFQVWLFEGSNHIQFGYSGIGTDGAQWDFDEPSSDALMAVGISSGSGLFISSANGGAILALDFTNICYKPDGNGYLENRAPCEAGPLNVECDPNPILRGEPITCEASTQDPEATLQVVEWQFTDGVHLVPYQPPDPGNRFWAGTMAVGGTVMVLVTVDGDSAEASTTVSVQPRDWPDVLPAPTVETVQCEGEPTNDCPLYFPPRFVEDFGQTHMPHPFEAELFLIEDDGPNVGLSFLLSEGPVLEYTKHVTYLNAILDQPNHSFWPAGCNVSAFKQTVVSHEQLHVSLMINNLEMADPGPNARLERITLWGSPDSLDIMLDDTLKVLEAVINQYGDQAHQVNPPVTLPCNVNVKP